MDDINNNFNPNKLPLDELKITIIGNDGVTREVPALDSHWLAPDKKFSGYFCLLSTFDTLRSGAELDEWRYLAINVEKDFKFLLQLKHHEFWSYMVYNKATKACLLAFLQGCNPCYRPRSHENESSDEQVNALAFYEHLLNLAVRVVMRLLTSNESPTEWIKPEHHSNLLYNHYLMSVPLLCDLVIALGDVDEQNVKTLQNIFDTLVRIQPKYKRDMMEGLSFFEDAFLSMQIQVENEGCEGAGGGPPLDPNADSPYDDVVVFALDCAYTLRLLLQYSPSLFVVCEELKTVQSISNFYDLTIPMLNKNIYQIKADAKSLPWLNEARQQYLLAVHYIANGQVQAGHGEQLVELLQECLSAQTFIVDLQRKYPVEVYLKLLMKKCPDLKNYNLDFLISGYQKAVSSCPLGTLADALLANGHNSDDEAGAFILPVEPLRVTTPTVAENGAARDLDLEASAVLDVLPDLGMGFIRRVLTRYENSEQAIAAILDENLPPDLANVDKQEVYLPDDPQDKLQSQIGVRHYNVHDGDKYDVLTTDNPQCIIKKGKGLPGGPRNAEQLLDDKRDIGLMRQRYEQYSMVEETPLERGDEYDDEYDDSYEALNDGQAPPLSLLREKLQQASATAASSAFEAQDADEDNHAEASDDDNMNATKRDEFCENPELIRARYQQRQMAKYGPRAKAEVVGAPKGQGQTQETTRNRSQKEAHKSSRANHNRKSGAAFKRSRGMIP
ncbi:activating signal cointegrator 1 complex subunit 2 [Drosophila mojavensis]|uniref:CUE domain-containing protein n=1 Tax=Drosophila mojavensis TaxID=7230 RepID=B4L1N1_DROMO|nr:activating signal cointegrator 1 complex subunit 2 [Drosophila mojavensis]EDW07667.1 uncharacterized protein Dmoj_GI14728 [Drosophila mojavensis]